MNKLNFIDEEATTIRNTGGNIAVQTMAAAVLWTIGEANIKTMLKKLNASLDRGKDIGDDFRLAFTGRAPAQGMFDGLSAGKYQVLFRANGRTLFFPRGTDHDRLEMLYYFLLSGDLSGIEDGARRIEEEANKHRVLFKVKANAEWLSECVVGLVSSVAPKMDLQRQLDELDADLARVQSDIVKKMIEDERDGVSYEYNRLVGRRDDYKKQRDEAADWLNKEMAAVAELGFIDDATAWLKENYRWIVEDRWLKDIEEEGCEICGAPIADDDTPVNPDTGEYDGCVWCREDADAKAEAEQVERVKAVLKDLKHYGQARMAPGGDDYCEIVYGQHNTVLNSGGYPEIEPVAGHTIYVSSDHSTYGFDPFTIGQRKHSKLWRIVKVNADGTRTYHYTAKKWSAKAVLIATAAGLDADDLFKGDPCEMYGKMRDLMELIDTAKGGK